jgi:hypothetical protein
VPPHINKFFRNACETRNKEASFLDFSLFDLVFGHFPINRYKSNNYKYVTLLRHPVDRAISQYFYWKNIVPENNLLALYRYPTITDIKNGNISFIDFLKTQKIGSFYSNYLGDKSPDEFLLVGFTESYDAFLHKLSELLNIKLSSDIQLRQGIKGNISDIELDQARSILQQDIKKYEAFYQYWAT